MQGSSSAFLYLFAPGLLGPSVSGRPRQHGVAQLLPPGAEAAGHQRPRWVGRQRGADGAGPPAHHQGEAPLGHRLLQGMVSF